MTIGTFNCSTGVLQRMLSVPGSPASFFLLGLRLESGAPSLKLVSYTLPGVGQGGLKYIKQKKWPF